MIVSVSAEWGYLILPEDNAHMSPHKVDLHLMEAFETLHSPFG